MFYRTTSSWADRTGFRFGTALRGRASFTELLGFTDFTRVRGFVREGVGVLADT
jgi:hypothetical protein